MTLISAHVVRVEQPEASLADIMNLIRLWLDSHKIEPAEFKTDTVKPGAIALDIRFKSEDEAQLFEQKFADSGLA